jgi:tetratricopeptide (TPR) repeat protein
MTYPLMLAVSGSIAATLLAVLAFLRWRKGRSATGLRLAARWVGMRGLLANSILAMFSGVSILAFTLSGEMGSWRTVQEVDGASVIGMSEPNRKSNGRALEALRDYAVRIADKEQSIAALDEGNSGTGDDPSLPDVGTMIARLAERLETTPDDVKGWTMLGWSYLNTGRPEKAVAAYEKAMQLEPDNSEIKQALDTARKSQAQKASQAEDAPPTDGSTEPNGAMVRGMVDRLTSRLEAAPHDEDGWKRLMRARMVLGETDAAKIALMSALAAFASDSQAKSRLTDWANGLGIVTN